MDYQKKLNQIIPGGAHTYSRGFDQFPSNAPQILSRGQGAYVWDPEGKKYLDYGMGLRSVTLGYAHPDVNKAAIREIENGNNLTRASITELKAAELLIDTIPSAEMVKFAKNGSNATTAAIKISRSYTGRRYVCIPKQHPFFSFDDWFIGTTPLLKGIPDAHTSYTLVFDYNDLNSLKLLFKQYPDDIAAVMLEPATTIVPCSNKCNSSLSHKKHVACPNTTHNFLQQVQDLCKREGALFILDEMITGFRWHLQGAQTYFGVQPDLSTFGKAMANGFSVAAVVGRSDVMEIGAIDKPGVERTFLLSTTHGGEMCGLGAFIETMQIYKNENVCRYLWEYGARLRDGLNQIASELSIADYFSMEGPAICLNYITRDSMGKLSTKFRTLYTQELIRHGVLMPWVAVSIAHGDEELALTFSAAKKALKIYVRALDEGVEKYLEGPEVRPVFRKYN